MRVAAFRSSTQNSNMPFLKITGDGFGALAEGNGQALLLNQSDFAKILANNLPWFIRDTPCPECGGLLFRKIRRDCLFCHNELWEGIYNPISSASHAVLRGKPVREQALSQLGVGAAELRAFLISGCRKIGSSPEGYGKIWGIYRKRPPKDFPRKVRHRCNRIENLEVRKRHNRKGITL